MTEYTKSMDLIIRLCPEVTPCLIFRFHQDSDSLGPRNLVKVTEMRIGNNISAVEVTHISKHGFWLLLSDEELLVPFDQFPWFRKGTIEQISDVQWSSPDHLYWPSLDVDLSVESIRNPAAFPLVSSSTTAPPPPQ